MHGILVYPVDTKNGVVYIIRPVTDLVLDEQTSKHIHNLLLQMQSSVTYSHEYC